jgi:hypothetical protein
MCFGMGLGPFHLQSHQVRFHQLAIGFTGACSIVYPMFPIVDSHQFIVPPTLLIHGTKYQVLHWEELAIALNLPLSALAWLMIP